MILLVLIQIIISFLLILQWLTTMKWQYCSLLRNEDVEDHHQLIQFIKTQN